MKILIIVTVFLIGSCNYKKEANSNESEVKAFNSLTDEYDVISKKITLKGDTLAFDGLYNYLSLEGTFEEKTDTLMYYSKIMAIKYDYKNAYFNYVYSFLEKKNIYYYDGIAKLNLSALNFEDKKLMKDWLLKMNQKNIITSAEYNSVQF